MTYVEHYCRRACRRPRTGHCSKAAAGFAGCIPWLYDVLAHGRKGLYTGDRRPWLGRSFGRPPISANAYTVGGTAVLRPHLALLHVDGGRVDCVLLSAGTQ